MAWWREADAGWLPACRCRPGAGSIGCAGLNTAHGVATGCQRRPASGCADVDRDWDDRTVYGGEHALPADVTIGTADPPGLSEWRKVTCGAFSGFPTNFGSLSHQLSPSCREPSLTCTAQLTGIGGSSFRENEPLHQFSSPRVSSLFTLYTGESNQSIAPEAAVSWSYNAG